MARSKSKHRRMQHRRGLKARRRFQRKKKQN